MRPGPLISRIRKHTRKKQHLLAFAHGVLSTNIARRPGLAAAAAYYQAKIANESQATGTSDRHTDTHQHGAHAFTIATISAHTVRTRWTMHPSVLLNPFPSILPSHTFSATKALRHFWKERSPADARARHACAIVTGQAITSRQ